MHRQTRSVLLSLVCISALCAEFNAQTVPAQTVKKITVRILDGKTARRLSATNFLVRIDHQDTIHNDWVHMKDDGSGVLTLPAGATVVSIQATYDYSMETYVNCDSARQKQNPQEHWYPVSKIMTSGVVAPNECSKMIETAQPGEFIFFVRKETWREQMND